MLLFEASGLRGCRCWWGVSDSVGSGERGGGSWGAMVGTLPPWDSIKGVPPCQWRLIRRNDLLPGVC